MEAVTGANALEQVRALLGEYGCWVADELGVDLSFQGFERELVALPGEYARPGGGLLLARVDGHAAGMAAVREGLDAAPAEGPRWAELKRLYARPAYRGRALGRRLTEAAVALAASLGYTEMRLDTLPGMEAAQRLYRDLGFHDIEPYYPNPVSGARFLGRRLAPAAQPLGTDDGGVSGLGAADPFGRGDGR